MAEYLAADKKQEIFAKYGKSNTDTGSAESPRRTSAPSVPCSVLWVRGAASSIT